MDIILGHEYEDKVSDFRGIATARYEFLNNCVRIQLTAKVAEAGKKPIDLVFDQEQLVEIGEGIEVDAPASGGGYMDETAPRE